jgi:serine/threonine protein kinase
MKLTLFLLQGILSDGEEIAVKTLLGRTGQALHQLHNEIQVLAKLQHKNLVRLLGYCLHQSDTLLVYEYIKNGSLDSILFGTFLPRSPLHQLHITPRAVTSACQKSL